MGATNYNYVNHMNVLCKPLERIDVNELVRNCKDQWYNQTLCEVNDSVARLGILQGEYHWHSHQNDDELFFVLDGTLLIDIEGEKTITLKTNQGVVVPKGKRHRPRAPEKVVVLMVETASIVPTGDES